MLLSLFESGALLWIWFFSPSDCVVFPFLLRLNMNFFQGILYKNSLGDVSIGFFAEYFDSYLDSESDSDLRIYIIFKQVYS